MSDDEDTQNEVSDLITPLSSGLIEQLMVAKATNPSAFPSYWELDENDVAEASEEQIKNDPVLRILWASETGSMEVLREMLARDASLVSARDEDGYSPLHRAAYEGHVDVIKFLLDNKADVNMLTNDHWTPLHSAANWGQCDAAAVLLSHGADINAQTAGRQTPLHLAAANSNCKKTLELLLMHPAVDYTLKNKQQETAADVAQRCCRYHYLFEMCDEAVNKL